MFFLQKPVSQETPRSLWTVIGLNNILGYKIGTGRGGADFSSPRLKY